MNIILKELQNCTTFRQAGWRLRALAMFVRANMRHYNIGVNSISRLLVRGDSNVQWASDDLMPFREPRRKVGL